MDKEKYTICSNDKKQTSFFCQIVGQKKFLSPETELNALILSKVRIT